MKVETVSISKIKDLLDQGYEVEVDSPDGFVPVNFFVDKGDWDEYVLALENGETVRVNENHLFETPLGWQFAKDLVDIPEQHYLTKDGYVKGWVTKTGAKIPIVDINVDHGNHRYYTNGVCSHNTGVGKSLAMCHMAAYNLLSGFNVLYVTMEMAEEKISQRIDANLLDCTVDELELLTKDAYEKKINRLVNKTTGKLIVKQFPTASAHSGHFRHLINELRLKKNFMPDIVYIDYLNICASARLKPGSNVNSYTYVKSIAEELRGLGVEFNVPIVSATQTTRSGFSNSDVGLEDTSESFGLPATADIMIALITSEELEALGQIMGKQLKNRYNDVGVNKRFVMGIDRSKMRLYEVEQSAQGGLTDSGAEDDTPVFDKSTFGSKAGKPKKAVNFDFNG